ncbi:4212_t:CDS:2 [Dentiscutata erythropus]|uniref:4212_t:CDS:1 n=1 Tax=Dentiscutata erythropus TaxID=1348616 RepID=A0A9N9AVP3_9GLOM|nr:4212_t:CDS:2 [Dentiscutata erythropus]
MKPISSLDINRIGFLKGLVVTTAIWIQSKDITDGFYLIHKFGLSGRQSEMKVV